MTDGLGAWVALLLTLFIFSSLLRDNGLSRLAEHLLVGTAAGYAGVVAVRQVLLPRLIMPLLSDPLHRWPLLVPVALGLLWLLPMLRPGRVARAAGALGLALLFGVGAGLVVSGAWLGTLWPQALAAARPALSVDGMLLLALTAAVPLFFFVRTREGGQKRGDSPSPWASAGNRLLRLAGGVGYVTLLITFGVIFARAGVARIALLVDRLQFVMDSVQQVGVFDLAQRLWQFLVGS